MAVDIPGYCTLCRSRCGTLNTVENGRLVRVAPLPSHPTGRAICAKGRAAPEIAHSSRRLTRPLRRTTPKGSSDPGWVPIGWDEALDEIAARLGAIREAHGAEAVAFALTSPSATPMVDSVEWVERFIQLFGSPNVCNATEICNWQKDTGHALTFGANLPLPDYANTDMVVLWGHNPSAVWLAEAGELADARARGARLAVIDPRRTGHAHQADHWLAVRPGTDAALALGLARCLIEAGTFGRDFVRQWTNGPLLVRDDNGRLLRWGDVEPGHPQADAFVVVDGAGAPRPFDPTADPRDAAASLALEGAFTVRGMACRTAFQLYAERCAAYPPDRVAAITGIPAGQVEALARELGTARAVSWYAWTGVGQHANSTATARAIGTLHALLGSFDSIGGNVLPTPLPANPISEPALLPAAQRAKALGAAQRPLGPAALGMVTARELYDSILDGTPYRVRALMTFGANLLLSRADADRGKAAFAALDFAVHCDLFDNPTARQADILLPVSSPWEREGLKLGFDVSEDAQALVQLRAAMIPRLGESRSDAEIACALAARMGFADRMFGGDIEAGHAHKLAPLGIAPDDLRRRPEGISHPVATRHRKFAEPVEGGVRGFATETRRIELYSERLLRHGQPPLPDFTRTATMPDPDGTFPFVLTCAKSPYFCQSQHRQVASLRRRSREPMVALAASIATARGIAAGDAVVVTTRTASARFVAAIDAELAPDVVVADFGWWRDLPDLALPGFDPFSDLGSNFNRIVDADDADPVSGAPALKSFACTVEKVARARVVAWPGKHQLVVAARHDHAGIVEIALADPAGAPLPPFLPGQHIGLTLDLPGHGPVERSYSLCGPGGADSTDQYRIAIRPIAPDGLFSQRCAALLRPGTMVSARAPSGQFLLPLAADVPVVLIAAGIGITPFLGYLHALADAPHPPEVVLYHGSRNSAHHAFGAEIASLAADTPSLTVITHFSRPQPGDRPDRTSRIDAGAVDRSLIDRRARFYLCGPGDMIASVTAGLVARGVPAFEIFSERFVSPPPVSVEAAGQAFAVTFARSGRTESWSPDKGDLLAFADGLGLSLPGGCRVGECESCALAVLDGAVTHRVVVADVGEDHCLACQAVPVSDLVVDA